MRTDQIERLREALIAAEFTPAGLVARLGQEVLDGNRRGDRFTTTRVANRDDSLDVLIRLFLCGHTERAAAVSAALPLADAMTAGLVEEVADGTVRAAVWLHTHEDWWVVTDLPTAWRSGPVPSDYVVGISAVPMKLARSTMRAQVGSALDIGTGCGVQALHLSRHADRVTATDISPRALRFAALTAALNGLDWELLQGDLTAPVAGRRFDLVVANPPYIIGPGGDRATHHYRDSGRPGDGICAELAAAAPGLLTEGGHLQYLAQWAHVRGQDWRERLGGWFAGTGCDAWVIQHNTVEPARYVGQWLAETGQHKDAEVRAAWLDHFESNDIEAVGSGLITMRNTGRADPVVCFDETPHTVDGAEVSAWFTRQDWLREHDPLSARYALAEDLTLIQEASPGRGWQLRRQLLTRTSGLRCAVEVAPLVAALAGECDGTSPVRDQIAALAAAHQLDAGDLAAHMVPVLTRLVRQGVLTPV